MLADAKVALPQLVQAVVVLAGANVVAPVQADAQVATARPRTAALNRYLCEKAVGSGEIVYLASPVCGGGVPVPRVHQLFLLARMQGTKATDEWARFAWRVLAAQGQKVIRGGKTLESEEDNIADLAAQAKAFAEKRLPILAALGIA
jgi:hypothetical protein